MNKRKSIRKWMVVFWLFLFSSDFSQDKGVISPEARHFQLYHKHERIDFIKLDTSLTEKKPVFLFCQGSLPVPLFVSFKEGVYMLGGGISNFNYREITQKYHLIVISMPETPVIVSEKQVSQSFCYIPDTLNPRQFSPEYEKKDFLEHYVKRAGIVLDFLKKQPWVDNNKLVVAGHSQGSKVATKIALKNKRITHIGLFAANPFGRVDQFVRESRLSAQSGKVSWEEADKQMEENYETYRQAFIPDSVKKYASLNSLKTFSEPFLEDWLELKIPVFLAYGTEDRTSELCDIVPLFFIREGKKNLTMKRYLHLEHNFFEVEKEGKTNYDKPHWPEVMHEFMEWVEKNGVQ